MRPQHARRAAAWSPFLTLALNTPTYTYAYHDAAVDGLTQLSRMMGLADGRAPVLRDGE
jgi:hypothetical protein